MRESDGPLITAALEELEGTIREKLSTGPSADVSGELRRAEELRRAISKPRRPWLPDAILSLTVAMVCLLVIFLAMNWRVGAIDLGFAIETAGVEVTSARPWPEPQEAMRLDESLTIAGIAEASGADPAIRSLPDRRRPVRIDFTPPADGTDYTAELRPDARYAHLSLPPIPEDSQVHIACLPDDFVVITVTGAPMDALVSVTGEAFVAGGGLPDGDVLVVPGGESLQLTSEAGVPMSFRVRKDDAATILAGAIGGIAFPSDQTVTPNLPRFTSAIQSGELTVRTVDQSYELDRFDELDLDGVDGQAVIEIGAGDCVDVAFEGLATSATLGKDPTMDNIVPTQLGFWFQDRQLPFYLTVFATIWGVLWGGVTWIRHRVV